MEIRLEPETDMKKKSHLFHLNFINIEDDCKLKIVLHLLAKSLPQIMSMYAICKAFKVRSINNIWLSGKFLIITPWEQIYIPKAQDYCK